VHDRAVLIAFNIRLQTLDWFSPGHSAFLECWDGPIAVALHHFKGFQGALMGGEVYEDVSQTSFSEEIHGEVDKVILASKTLLVQDVADVVPPDVIGAVAKHHSCLVAIVAAGHCFGLVLFI